MKNYQNYSDTDLRLFKAAAKVNNNNQADILGNRKVLVDDGRINAYAKTSFIRQPEKIVQKSVSLTKINFIYHQPKSQKSLSFDKYTQTHKIQQKTLIKQKPFFMNVISKNYIPKDVLKFVYGKPTPQSIDDPNSTQTHHHSFGIRTQESHYRSIKNNDKIYDRNPLQRMNCLMSPIETFEHFPTSKIKRSRNNSRKSSSSDLQLSSNCKNQNQPNNQIQKITLKQQKQPQNNLNKPNNEFNKANNDLYKPTDELNNCNDELNNCNNDVKQQIQDNQQIQETSIQQKFDNNQQPQKSSNNLKPQELNNYMKHQEGNNNLSKNSLEPQEQDNFLEHQEWNNTIKFNNINLNDSKMGRLANTNDSSTFNKTNTIGQNTASPNTQKIKNQTQKITQFILCDEQIGIQENPFKNKNLNTTHFQIVNHKPNKHNKINNQIKKVENNYLFEQYQLPEENLKKKIPVFQIKLSDLQQPQNQQNNKKDKIDESQSTNKQEDEKILPNIETSETLGGLRQNQNIQPNTFHIYDRLESSIQQLGKNIGDLSGKISQINKVKHQQQTVSMKQKQKRLQLKSNCYSQQVTSTVFYNKQQNYKIQLINQLQQKQNELLEIVNESVQQRFKQRNVEKNEKQFQQHPYSHYDGQSQNQFLNLSYSRELKQHQHFLQIQQKNKPSQINTLNQNHVLGSLQIINHSHQTQLMGQSLHNLYSNQKNSQQVQKNNQTHINIQQKNNINVYPNNLFPQENSKHVHFQDFNDKNFNQSCDSIPQQRQNKNLTQNFLNKLQRQKRIRQFYSVKTFQKTRSKSQIQKTTKNKVHNLIGTQKNWSKKTYDKTIEQNFKLFESKGLNYEMYKTYRDKSYSKRSTLLGLDHRKQRKIQLPYMEKPFDLKLNREPTYLPKYIKSKVYYVKG